MKPRKIYLLLLSLLSISINSATDTRQIRVHTFKRTLGVDEKTCDKHINLNVNPFSNAKQIIEEAISTFKRKGIQCEPCKSISDDSYDDFLAARHVFLLYDYTRIKAHIANNFANDCIDDPIKVLASGYSGVQSNRIKYGDLNDCLLGYFDEVDIKHEFLLLHTYERTIGIDIPINIPDSVYVYNLSDNPVYRITSNTRGLRTTHIERRGHIPQSEVGTAIFLTALISFISVYMVYKLFSKNAVKNNENNPVET